MAGLAVNWALGTSPALGPHTLGAGGGYVDLATGSTTMAFTTTPADLARLALAQGAERAAARQRWVQLHAGLMCGAWVGLLPLGLLMAEHRFGGRAQVGGRPSPQQSTGRTVDPCMLHPATRKSDPPSTTA